MRELVECARAAALWHAVERFEWAAGFQPGAGAPRGYAGAMVGVRADGFQPGAGVPHTVLRLSLRSRGPLPSACAPSQAASMAAALQRLAPFETGVGLPAGHRAAGFGREGTHLVNAWWATGSIRGSRRRVGGGGYVWHGWRSITWQSSTWYPDERTAPMSWSMVDAFSSWSTQTVRNSVSTSRMCTPGTRAKLRET